MKRAPRSRQRHDLYAKYHDYDSEISDLLGECGLIPNYLSNKAATESDSNMLQCELSDGRMIFVNLDRVNNINNMPNGEMILTYLDSEGKAKRNAIRRFQIIKTATWFRADHH